MNNTINDKKYYWYVLRTKPRAEKQAYLNLIEKKIITFLPLIKTLRKWSDRKKMVEVPLFNSYIFIKIPKRSMEKVRFTPGVLGFIKFNGMPAIIPEKQIIDIKKLISVDIDIETTEEKFEPGEKVIIKSGPLKGIIGELVQYRGTHKVILRVDHINHAIVFEVPINKLTKLDNNTTPKQLLA